MDFRMLTPSMTKPAKTSREETSPEEGDIGSCVVRRVQDELLLSNMKSVA